MNNFIVLSPNEEEAFRRQQEKRIRLERLLQVRSQAKAHSKRMIEQYFQEQEQDQSRKLALKKV